MSQSVQRLALLYLSIDMTYTHPCEFPNSVRVVPNGGLEPAPPGIKEKGLSAN